MKFAILALAIGQALQIAAPSASLRSTTPWASYDEGYRCTVERTFGPKPGVLAIKVALDPFGGADFDLILRTSMPSKRLESVTFGFDDGEAPLETTSQIASYPKFGVVFARATLLDPTSFWDRFRKSKQLRMIIDGVERARIEYVSAEPVVRQAEICVERAFARYGAVRPTIWPKMIVKGRIIYDSEYPAEALNAARAGKTRTYVTVDTEGKPAKCTVVRSSGTRVLDDAACTAIKKRLRYEPARDAAGKPVVAISSFNVSWQLEGDDFLDSTFALDFIGAGQGGGIAN